MSIENPEKYTPSDEEIKKAGENMTDAQAYISNKREESVKKLKEIGVDGYLERLSDGKISGKINGHKIEIVQTGDSHMFPHYEVFVDDNFKLTEGEAHRFAHKYLGYNSENVAGYIKSERKTVMINYKKLDGTLGRYSDTTHKNIDMLKEAEKLTRTEEGQRQIEEQIQAKGEKMLKEIGL